MLAFKLILVVFGSLWILQILEAKVWTKCEFLTALQQHNFTEEEMTSWLCTSEVESKLNSSLKQPAVFSEKFKGCMNQSGFGIFQIPSMWCGDTDLPDYCRSDKCTSSPWNGFLDDDLTDDIECVRTMHVIYGSKPFIWPFDTPQVCINPQTVSVNEICAQGREDNVDGSGGLGRIMVAAIIIGNVFLGIVVAVFIKMWKKRRNSVD